MRQLVERRHEVLPFLGIGMVCVITGAFIAAATAPAPTEYTTWAAAYLVLVGGVAQVGLGFGQVMFAGRTSPPVIAAEVVGWNVGNAVVLVGTLLGVTTVVDVGGVLLLVTLGFRPAACAPPGNDPSAAVADGLCTAIGSSGSPPTRRRPRR